MLPPVPLYFLRRQTDHSLLAPVLPQAAAPYGNSMSVYGGLLVKKEDLILGILYRPVVINY